MYKNELTFENAKKIDKEISDLVRCSYKEDPKFEKAFLDLLGLVATYSMSMINVIDEKVSGIKKDKAPNYIKANNESITVTHPISFAPCSVRKGTITSFESIGNITHAFEKTNRVYLYKKIINDHGYTRKYARNSDDSLIEFFISGYCYDHANGKTKLNIINFDYYDTFMGLKPEEINSFLRIEMIKPEPKPEETYPIGMSYERKKSWIDGLSAAELTRNPGESTLREIGSIAGSIKNVELKGNQQSPDRSGWNQINVENDPNFDPNMIFNIKLDPNIEIGLCEPKCDCGGHKAKEPCFNWCTLEKLKSELNGMDFKFGG